MKEFSHLLIALLVCLVILRFLKKLQSCKRLRYPPGPLRLPFIGSIYYLGFSLSEESLTKVAKKYGNIFMVWLKKQPIVILCGYDTVKEVLINHEEYFLERPVLEITKWFTHEKGIVTSNGHTWEQQRRFGKITLRMLGLGKKSIEGQIEQEAQQLVESIGHLQGQPFNPSLYISNSVSNVICVLAFGHRFSIDDKEFQRLIASFQYILSFSSSIFNGFFELFPRLLKYLPGPHWKVFSCSHRVQSFLKKQIDGHKEQQALHDPQDFIDFYLLQMEKSKGDPNTTYDEDNLVACISDLFVAGTDTATSTLGWALLLMAAHPDVQEKVQKEIEEVWGSSPLISYHDRKKLPYTNAVIQEMQRSQYALLYGVPRQCSQDVNILGFLVPKGAYVIPDLRSVLNDPKVWETPQEFNPNHFLDKNQHFRKREEFLPFGTGERSCLGEHLARMEVFIFFISLMRAFTFKLPEGVKEINKKAKLGMTAHPRPQKLCAVPRHNSSS